MANLAPIASLSAAIEDKIARLELVDPDGDEAKALKARIQFLREQLQVERDLQLQREERELQRQREERERDLQLQREERERELQLQREERELQLQREERELQRQREEGERLIKLRGDLAVAERSDPKDEDLCARLTAQVEESEKLLGVQPATAPPGKRFSSFRVVFCAVWVE